jgi:hypothetical protein
MFDEFLITLLRIAELAALIALPMWLRYTLSGLMRHHDGIGYFAVPGLARLSFFSGVIFGGTLIYVNHDPKFYYFDNVFAVGGPWDVSFIELFTVWLNPLRYSPLVLWEKVAPLDIHDTLTGFVLTSAGAAAAVVVAAIYYFRRQFFWALLKSAAVWLWSAGLVIYVACAGAWALNMLNFWAVVLAFLLVRHRSLAEH